MDSEMKCPVTGGTHTPVAGTSNRDWWPNALDLKILHQGHPGADPMGTGPLTGSTRAVRPKARMGSTARGPQ